MLSKQRGCYCCSGPGGSRGPSPCHRQCSHLSDAVVYIAISWHPPATPGADTHVPLETEAWQGYVACPRAQLVHPRESRALSAWSPRVSPPGSWVTMGGSLGCFCGSFTWCFLPLQIKYHEEFEKSRMGPSGGEGMEPERRDSQDSTSYRRPQEQQPHHIPTGAPGEHGACGGRGPEAGPATGWGEASFTCTHAHAHAHAHTCTGRSYLPEGMSARGRASAGPQGEEREVPPSL